MTFLVKAFVAVVWNFATLRVPYTPIDHDYIDTVIMDMECDADYPECEIVVNPTETHWQHH